MSTKALIDRVQPHASGWSRMGTRSLLTLAKQGQDLLFDYDSPYMHFISTDNKGFPPYLKTAAGTYRYNIETANLSCTLAKTIGGVSRAVRCREVVAIFVDTSENFDYMRTWIGEPYNWNFGNPYRYSNERTEFARLPAHKEPALEDTLAFVDFQEDPGTETELYFCDLLWEPPRLTAETIPLVIPELYEMALERYMIGRIQELSSGQPSNQMKEFIEYWVPKFRSEVCNPPGNVSMDAVLNQS